MPKDAELNIQEYQEISEKFKENLTISSQGAKILTSPASNTLRTSQRSQQSNNMIIDTSQ